MLYVTTREKYDAFTAARAIHNDRGPDGGLYLPYKMPYFTPEELRELLEQSFGQTVAHMLNLLFSTHFTAWDVEFCIGRYPIRVAPMGQKVLVAECWRNLDGSYEKMERQIASRISGCSAWDVKITSWVRIGVRIAVLFGIFSELLRQGQAELEKKVDIAVPDGDFSIAMAVWYGRKMGLPIANIICGCGDDSAVWDLLRKGQLRSSALAGKPELERLVYGCFGVAETLNTLRVLNSSGIYTLTPEQQSVLRHGMYASVVSDERMRSVIPNVYHTSAYIMEPDAAVSYSALMDFRARTGESRYALLLADRNPVDAAKDVSDAMQMTQQQLKDLLNR